MALGKTGTANLESKNYEIFNAIKFGNEQSESIYSVWNTFNYVAKNLSGWADETTIGTNVKQNIINLSNSLYDLMVSTNKLNDKLDKFIFSQKQLNQYDAGDLRAFQ